jgi:DNA repair protein RecO (recombination protein O)
MDGQERLSRRIRSQSLEAVVLRRTDWGEADRLLVLYTREQGKLRAIAKGVRKMRSRKAGHLEPFTHVKMLLARGRDIGIITQAEAIDLNQTLREDIMLASCASYVVELLDRFTAEEGPNRALFRLLLESLDRLGSGSSTSLVLRYYEMRLLDLAGYRPQLFNCTNCKNEIKPQDQYFSAGRGGAVCPDCRPLIADARPVSETALKYLRHFQRSAFPDAARAKPTPAASREMEKLMGDYLTYVLERELNSPAFIRRARENSQLR